MLDNTQHINDVLQSETGKARVDASFEPTVTADLLNYWAGSAEKFLTDTHPKPHGPLGKVKKLTTVYRPYPVVGVITPWNFPFLMPGLDSLARDTNCHTALADPQPQLGLVIPLVGVQLARPASPRAAPPAHRRDRFHQRSQSLRVMHVGGRNRHGQRNSGPIGQHVDLRAGFAAVGG